MTTQIDDDIGFAPDIDSASDSYAKRFSGLAGQWLLKKQQTLTQQHLLALKAERVLDVGGGHAQNVEPIEALNIPLTVSGSDSICQKRVVELSHSRQTDFMLGNLSNLPTADQSYPIVISYRIVSHMLDWRGFIDELTRVSSNAVIIDFAAKRSINWFSELAYKLKRGKEGDTRRFNVLAEADVNAAFAKNGFGLIKRSPQFFFPMAIHRALKNPKLSNALEVLAYYFGLNALFGSPIISTYQRQSFARDTLQNNQQDGR
jgi:ubiquinone/menaquinone biosynthesis C-methylase UbiE